MVQITQKNHFLLQVTPFLKSYLMMILWRTSNSLFTQDYRVLQNKEVNVQRHQQQLFTLVHNHHTENGRQVYIAQFIQQHTLDFYIACCKDSAKPCH